MTGSRWRAIGIRFYKTYHMQRFPLFLAIAAITALTACNHGKKILVYATSDSEIKVDETQKNITVADGSAHHEKELDFSGGDPVTLNIQTPSGKLTLQASEDGLYIVNLKMDTVVGSYQHVGADNGQTKITQDALKQKLDSLQKLVLDQNVSAANRNFFIAPNQMVRITPETKAKVFGPYVTIPGDFDASTAPEIYKFYTNKEVREIIGNLTKMANVPQSGGN
jgi:hypothetical protein